MNASCGNTTGKLTTSYHMIMRALANVSCKGDKSSKCSQGSWLVAVHQEMVYNHLKVSIRTLHTACHSRDQSIESAEPHVICYGY